MLKGLHASRTVRGRVDICFSDGDISSRLLLGDQRHLVHIRYPHRHPNFHCWDRRHWYHAYVPSLSLHTRPLNVNLTEVLLADNFFDVYLHAIPGAKLDSSIGLIQIPPSSISSMQPLNFTIAGTVFSMDVAAQLIPTSQNVAWGGVAGKQYGVVANLGSNSGEGLDFIIGQKFMERYYAVSHGTSLGKGKHELTGSTVVFGRCSTRTLTESDLLRRESWFAFK